MANHNPRLNSRSNEREELWFSLPGTVSRQQDHSREPEATAYQATSNRHSMHQRSLSPSRYRYPQVPSICTTTAINKPLPPVPDPEKKKRGPSSIRSLIRRRPSGQLDPSHLQPEPNQQQRSSSTNGNLAPDSTLHCYPQQASRSMPSSPAVYSENIPPPATFSRAHSAAANYPGSQHIQIPQQQHRSVSMNTYFEPGQVRTRRTFPDADTPASATTVTARESFPDRPRPHTWLSPTEPFEDANDFHLFVEATSGLTDGSLDSDTMSPNGRPQLQGSLFARGRQNDVIPLPMQYAVTSQPRAMDYDYTPAPSYSFQSASTQLVLSSSALPRPDSFAQSSLTLNMNDIDSELERLGLDQNDDVGPEDELPNYAQSQAEMASRKRAEATNRARELEARWNNSRGS
ncbi:hypothetical protein K504DRAFT_429393 [Pleomassaria siparia CBS 279.74]|uniref:Uncharacterized protein n=1 Tax=Pleomassaria siparia CBS 279.74 TaxID=1314801 RepID=A0A6G1KDQ1_9PLEO|nr:hypothetical protein K504DRAFT_429393 [Pleomassaria siparia CBS 279.74]